MKKALTAILGLVFVVALSIGIKAFAQSANIVAVENIASDCSTVTLNDAAGSLFGPYTNSQATQALQYAESDRIRTEEKIGDDDAKIAAAQIALQAFSQCIANQTNQTNGV